MKKGERILSKNQIDEIVEKYQTRLSTVKLGEEYNVSYGTIINYLKARGVKLRPGGPPSKLTKEQKDKISQKYLAGASLSNLAKEEGVNRDVIRYALTKLTLSKLKPKNKIFKIMNNSPYFYTVKQLSPMLNLSKSRTYKLLKNEQIIKVQLPIKLARYMGEEYYYCHAPRTIYFLKKYSSKVTEEVASKISENLPKNERIRLGYNSNDNLEDKVLNSLETGKNIQELNEELPLKRSHLQRCLNILKEKGFIERVENKEKKGLWKKVADASLS